MGTLIIGLRSVEAELGWDTTESDGPVVDVQSRRPIRAALAVGLRSLADRLEPAQLERAHAGTSTAR